MKTEQQFPLQYYLEVAWRRKWWIVIPFLISIGVSIGVIAYLPKTYRSSTTILVESQKVPEEYVKSAISGTIEDRLSTIRQQILSRSLLQKIIDEFGLYKKQSKRMTSEGIIGLIMKRIDIGTVGNKKTIDAFTVSFEGETPVEAMNVTNKLTSLFVEENLKTREQLIEGTSEFLENELESMRQLLEKQEEEIREYKKRHIGELPQQMEANLRTLDRYQIELQSIVVALKAAEERKTNLEKMLSDGSRAFAASATPSLDAIQPIDPEYARLDRMKQELEQLRAEYKDTFPDIIVLNRQIKELEDNLSKRPVREEEVKSGGVTEKRGEGLSILPQEIAFYRDLQRQLQEVGVEIRSLRERQQEVQKQVRLYERRVENAPEREQQMTTLLRDYENTRKNYQALLDKKLNAKISENLEKRQKGEQFKVLDPANLPEKPFRPDRMRLFGWGLACGLGIGFGLVLLVESLDTSFKRPEEVEETLGIPVLASIPQFDRKKVKAGLLIPTERTDIFESAYSERLDGE